MTEQERLLAALEYQEAQRPALMNPNLMRQGQRMNLPARQAPGPMAEFVTQAMSLDPQPDQGLGTVGAEMGLSLFPGVGQAMGLRDVERGRRANDPVMMGLGAASLIPVGKLISALRGGKQMGPVSELDVYHGSPHKMAPTERNPLGEFDPTKIGTGEGAQAYGYGHYLAESKSTANYYADALAIDHRDSINKVIQALPAKPTADDVFFEMQRHPSLKDFLNSSQVKNDIISAKSGAEDGGTVSLDAMGAYKRLDKLLPPPQKSLYKVDLPDEQIAKMLDWDKPLSQQSKEVQDAFKLQGIGGTPAWDEITGLNLYNQLAGRLNVRNPSPMSGSEAASDFLQKAGIPGIRYLDQGSRVGGKGTSNFVVFPGGEKMLNILERQ